jgi:hypothetical protein
MLEITGEKERTKARRELTLMESNSVDRFKI